LLSKKYISLLLILLIVFNSFGYVVAFLQLKLVFKNIGFEKVIETHPEQQITVLKIPQKEISENKEFIEINESEISYYGKMYDICRKEVSGTDVIFYCYNDEREDALISVFSSFVQQNTIPNSDNPVTNLIKNLIKDAYFVKYTSRINQNSFCEFYTLNIQPYRNVFLDVITPPPKIS
jgi:hypothetical protein